MAFELVSTAAPDLSGLIPVLGVGRPARRLGADGRAEAAGQPSGHVVIEIFLGHEPPRRQLVVLERDPLTLLASEVTAVEDEQKPVALAIQRSPVDDEEGSNGQGEAEFLVDLADAGGAGRLTGLDVPAGDVPLLLIGGAHEQDAAGLVGEEGTGGDAWRGHRELVRFGYVGHRRPDISIKHGKRTPAVGWPGVGAESGQASWRVICRIRQSVESACVAIVTVGSALSRLASFHAPPWGTWRRDCPVPMRYGTIVDVPLATTQYS